MAITTLDGLIGASKVVRPLHRTAGLTTVAGGYFTNFHIAGANQGVLAGGETTPPANTAGRVPTDTIPGYPDIPWSSLRSYLTRLSAQNTVTGTMRVFDRLWVGGTYAFNANVAVTASSYSSRVSYNGGSADYKGLEIWAETVTAATGNQTWNVTYTDQDGNTGATTGATGIGAAPSVGRCWQLPLAAGDSGVQTITNVTGGTGSAGTANIMVLRPLFDAYLSANAPAIFNWADLGMPEIFNDSAIYCLWMAPSGTALGTVGPLNFQFANG
jgi:hypothetical protein